VHAGLLDREDFEKGLNWSVLILIGGGLALGHVMERSYLLHIASETIVNVLGGSGAWRFMVGLLFSRFYCC
jgi:di/tricarboxylate transporter